MAPEYGATCGFFPVDEETLKYLRFSGRDEQTVKLVEDYAKAQGLWASDDTVFTDTVSLDMSTVVPTISGPKRPQDKVLLTEASTNFKKVSKEIIKRDLPLFGICLGHQVIALANGISTYKMHNGHRGINHPVKNLLTGKGEITSQNHGFAINREETESHSDVEITHIHLNDHTVAGIRLKNKNCFSVQYHPEASPGPHDAEYLFDQFMENIK